MRRSNFTVHSAHPEFIHINSEPKLATYLSNWALGKELRVYRARVDKGYYGAGLSIMQHASPEVSEVATLLITAAALIVDFSIRRDQTQDRIVLAVLLWLTCSLQTNPPQLSILVQCIFFGIIVAALSCSPIVLWKISLYSFNDRID